VYSEYCRCCISQTGVRLHAMEALDRSEAVQREASAFHACLCVCVMTGQPLCYTVAVNAVPTSSFVGSLVAEEMHVCVARNA
jgi:NADPH-dependent 7-cyano-7-deazaguanine reductase QueF